MLHCNEPQRSINGVLSYITVLSPQWFCNVFESTSTCWVLLPSGPARTRRKHHKGTLSVSYPCLCFNLFICLFFFFFFLIQILVPFIYAGEGREEGEAGKGRLSFVGFFPLQFKYALIEKKGGEGG